MPMINPLNIFSVSDLAETVNLIPNKYGRLNEMNLFPVKGSTVDTISIEEKNGVLTMIPSGPDGYPGVVGSRKKRKIRTFKIPQMVFDEHLSAKDVNGARAFGGNTQQVLAEELTDKLELCRGNHDITLEFLRMGAMKGKIIDGDGESVLYDLFDEFGITKKNFDFKFSAAGTDIKKVCLNIARHIEDNLMGESMSGIRVLVDSVFFDALTSHPKVVAAYERWESGAALRDDMRSGFPFGGLIFEEYRGKANSINGLKTFLDEGAGQAFPEGTGRSFKTYAGPADFNEAVGKLGQLYYAKITPTKNDRGFDIHTQANVLPISSRPGCLPSVSMS